MGRFDVVRRIMNQGSYYWRIPTSAAQGKLPSSRHVATGRELGRPVPLRPVGLRQPCQAIGTKVNDWAVSPAVHVHCWIRVPFAVPRLVTSRHSVPLFRAVNVYALPDCVGSHC